MQREPPDFNLIAAVFTQRQRAKLWKLHSSSGGFQLEKPRKILIKCCCKYLKFALKTQKPLPTICATWALLPLLLTNSLQKFASACLPHFIYDPKHIRNNPKSIPSRAACKNSKKIVMNEHKARIAIHIFVASWTGHKNLCHIWRGLRCSYFSVDLYV